jgi:hypothetical protein
MSVSPIIEKVQKLLALSKSSNAHEAANAAGLANKLIDQYRLSAVDLESNLEEELEPIEEDSEYIYESGKITAWKSLLVSILVRHYGCAYWNDTTYTSGRKVSRYRLVGKRSDIGIARYMFSYLTAECSRLAELEAKGCGRVFVGSYCQGFVRGVGEQLKASRVEAQKTATSTSIIKIDARESEATEALYKLHNNLRTVKSSSHAQIDWNAYSMGKTKGQNLHLGASLNSGGTKALGK